MQTFYHGSHRQFEKFDISVLRSVRSRGAKTFVWFVLSFLYICGLKCFGKLSASHAEGDGWSIYFRKQYTCWHKLFGNLSFYLRYFNTTIHFLGIVARARLSRRTGDCFVARINRAARGESLSACPTLRSFQSLVWG